MYTGRRIVGAVSTTTGTSSSISNAATGNAALSSSVHNNGTVSSASVNSSVLLMNGASRANKGAAARNGGSSSSSASTGTGDFYPKLIAIQIVCLQCFHYFLLAVLFQINSFLYGTNVTLDRIFTDEHVQIWHVQGWPDCCAIWLASLVGSVLLTMIVEKSKKCLDFSVTLFVLHVLLCTYYQGGRIPHTMDWWIVHILGTIIMVLLGEYLCSRREMEEIPLLQL